MDVNRSVVKARLPLRAQGSTSPVATSNRTDTGASACSKARTLSAAPGESRDTIPAVTLACRAAHASHSPADAGVVTVAPVAASASARVRASQAPQVPAVPQRMSMTRPAMYASSGTCTASCAAVVGVLPSAGSLNAEAYACVTSSGSVP